jgi:hypothetical protein
MAANNERCRHRERGERARVESDTGKELKMTDSTLFRRSAYATCTFAAGVMLVAGAAWAQSGAEPATQAGATGAAPAVRTARESRSATRRTAPLHQQQVTGKAKKYYVGAWGVDKMKVSYTSSGNLIRFSYRVLDTELAKALSSKVDTPVMVGLRSRAVLQVPVMDKVGPLRQAAAPVVGQEYWMMFSNKGNLVRPGDRVSVVIGSFHADGLMVE